MKRKFLIQAPMKKRDMAQVTVEVIRRPCVFVLQILRPNDTLRRLTIFFEDRHMAIDTLHLYSDAYGEAMVIIHCQVEKAHIAGMIQLLKELPGITGVEKMEAE